ncbi:TetR/AcrR family transcriptional regulator [Actinomycetospora succinea]|uniref:TetR/AcrR family transcriptional regulator n=1 Tax=Actinomycetospora succinea TaxID=663603 RepID=UPI00105D1731|nr:TetR family transcriptional regulator [Actinomycetospora succinea]
MIDGGPTRREQLVSAAFGLVAEVGLEGLRLRRVADEVGIDQSTLHYHVATKAELVEAVAEHAAALLATSAPPSHLPPREALAAHLDALAGLIATRPELFTVTAELDLRARRDPSVRAVVDRQEAGWREVLVGLFTALDGDDDPSARAELVIAAVKGVRLVPDLAPTVLARLVEQTTGATR